jgi:hypothetical protein
MAALPAPDPPLTAAPAPPFMAALTLLLAAAPALPLVGAAAPPLTAAGGAATGALLLVVTLLGTCAGAGSAAGELDAPVAWPPPQPAMIESRAARQPSLCRSSM